VENGFHSTKSALNISQENYARNLTVYLVDNISFELGYRVKPSSNNKTVFFPRYEISIRPNSSSRSSIKLIKFEFNAFLSGSEYKIRNFFVDLNCRFRVKLSLANLAKFRNSLDRNGNNSIRISNCVILNDLRKQSHLFEDDEKYGTFVFENNTLTAREFNYEKSKSEMKKSVLSRDSKSYLKCLLRFVSDKSLICKTSNSSLNLDQLVGDSYALLGSSSDMSLSKHLKADSRQTKLDFEWIIFVFFALFLLFAVGIYSVFIAQQYRRPLKGNVRQKRAHRNMNTAGSSFYTDSGSIFSVEPDNYYESKFAENPKQSTSVSEEPRSEHSKKTAKQKEEHYKKRNSDFKALNPLKVMPRLVSSIEKAKRDMQKKKDQMK
jgi:hypothetical protein